MRLAAMATRRMSVPDDEVIAPWSLGSDTPSPCESDAPCDADVSINVPPFTSLPLWNGEPVPEADTHLNSAPGSPEGTPVPSGHNDYFLPGRPLWTRMHLTSSCCIRHPQFWGTDNGRRKRQHGDGSHRDQGFLARPARHAPNQSAAEPCTGSPRVS